MADLTINRVETRILDVPLIRPHGFATTTSTVQHILLVGVHLDNGVVGYGEGVVPGGPWWGGESVETMQALIDGYLAGFDHEALARGHAQVNVNPLDREIVEIGR